MNNFLYNYMNQVNQPNFYNKDDNNLFDPYNAFIRGNLFKNLYDPYKNNEPYEIRPKNEQAQFLTKIDSLCFTLKDLNLYLDVYPDNKNLISLYNKYMNEEEKLIKEYENMYGPITLNSDSLNNYPWSWNDTPWPWEN